MSKNAPKPPKHLSASARKWWRTIIAEYGIADSGGLFLLTSALEAYDRANACRIQINQDGETELNRFGEPRPHHLLGPEKDARGQMLSAFQKLQLDMEGLV